MSSAGSVYLENYGCSTNLSDAEAILGILDKAGFSATKEPENADIIVVNTCAVKKQTEDKILTRLKELEKLGRPLIVSGCLTKVNLEAVKRAAPGVRVTIDPRSIHYSSLAARFALNGSSADLTSREPFEKPILPKIRLNPLVETVEISSGCLGSCSFCCTKNARGKLFSYKPMLLLQQVENAVAQGVKEVWLTSQDAGAYGLDVGFDLPSLLESMTRIPGDFRIRLGMMNPEFALRYKQRLARILQHERMYRFIHVPVQSGSNKILKDMARLYFAEEFESLISFLRNIVPDLVVATDVIVGFPTETEDDFQETLTVVKKTRPDVTNISRYTHRPSTKASQLRLLPPSVVNERSARLTSVCTTVCFENNSKYVNTQEEILVTEREQSSRFLGRLRNYKQVVFSSEDDLLGKKALVRVLSATPRHLEAQVLYPSIRA